MSDRFCIASKLIFFLNLEFILWKRKTFFFIYFDKISELFLLGGIISGINIEEVSKNVPK